MLEALPSRIGADDPFVREARVGRYKPGVVRLVLDLKTEVNPQAFSLRPVGEYAHRLVLDVYPARPVDPLLALITELEQQRAADHRRPPRPPPARSEEAPQAPSEPAARAETPRSPPQDAAKSGDSKRRPASREGRPRSSG